MKSILEELFAICEDKRPRNQDILGVFFLNIILFLNNARFLQKLMI